MKDWIIRYCNICNDTKDNIRNLSILGMSQREENFYKGFLIWDQPSENICPCCNKGNPIETGLTNEEIGIIAKVSNYDRNFLEAMIKLKKDNIIDYELKMSHFRNQVAQQKQLEKQQQDSGNPHCPTCGSTNLEKISESSKIMDSIIWGIGGKQRYKTYHCNNCGYEW